MNVKTHPDSGIHQLLGQVRVRIRQAQRRAVELRDVQTVLERSHRSAAHLVQQRALRIIKKVKARRNELVRALHQKKVEQNSLLEAEINDTEMYTENMVGMCEQTESLLAMGMKGVRADLEVQLRSILNQRPAVSEVGEIHIPTFSPDKIGEVRLGEIYTNVMSVSSSSLLPVVTSADLGEGDESGQCSGYNSDTGSFVNIHLSDVASNAGEPLPIRIGSHIYDIETSQESIKGRSLHGNSLDDIDSSLTYEEFKTCKKSMVSSDRGSTSYRPKDVQSEDNLTIGWNDTFPDSDAIDHSLVSSLSSPCLLEDNIYRGRRAVQRSKSRKWSVADDTVNYIKGVKSILEAQSDYGYETASRKTWSSMTNNYEYIEEPRMVFCVQKWGSAPGQLNNPHDVAFLQNGNVAVSESNRLQIFDISGRSVRIIGEGYIKPRHVVVTTNGTIAVTDKKDHCIKIFSPEGTLVRSWGKNVFKGPTGVTLYGRDKFVVTDVGKNATTIHFYDGRMVREFGSRAIAATSIKAPCYLTSDADSNIYLANHFEHHIYMFDSLGQQLRRIGKKGSSDGKIRNPRGITVDLNGNLVVVDSHNDRLVVFDRDGRFVRNLLRKKDSIKDPGGVSVSSQDGYLAFTENGWKDKLKVYQIYSS